MKTIKKNWVKLALLVGGGVMVVTLFATGILWGQSAPGLGIAVTGSNQLTLTVTNGIPTGQYQIYYREFLDDPDYPWLLWVNGSTGQTNFVADIGDTEIGFFKAVNNTNFLPPSISVIIQSPLNGSVIQ